VDFTTNIAESNFRYTQVFGTHRVDDVATALPWCADTDYPADHPRIADVLFGVATSP
jgi:hypothetical protein